MGALINRTINGVNFTIEANGWSTRSAWGHEARLFKNGIQISECRIRYYNRTWECYQYQTAIKNAIYKELQRIEARTVEAWKEKNGRIRIMKAQRAAALEASTEYQTARRLYESI